MKKLAITLLSTLVPVLVVVFGFLFFQAEIASAFDSTRCTYDGQCVDNQKCYSPCGGGCGVWVANGPCGSAVVGGIRPPDGVKDFNLDAAMQGSGGNAIGLFVFVSRALRLFTIICGLGIFLTFLWAGYALITQAGNSKAYSDVRERLQYALVGLIIVVSAYTIAAIIGLIFFGNPAYLINPDLASIGAI